LYWDNGPIIIPPSFRQSISLILNLLELFFNLSQYEKYTCLPFLVFTIGELSGIKSFTSSNDDDESKSRTVMLLIFPVIIANPDDFLLNASLHSDIVFKFFQDATGNIFLLSSSMRILTVCFYYLDCKKYKSFFLFIQLYLNILTLQMLLIALLFS